MVEFGASWCPHCQRAQPTISRMLRQMPQVQHIKVEDGPEQRLGRSFQVKIWPTLLFQRDGVVIGRLVRPSSREIEDQFVVFVSPTGNEPVSSPMQS